VNRFRRYKRFIPIIALVLVGLGVNLDNLGIDLKSLSRGGPISQQGQTNNDGGASFSGGKSSKQQDGSKRSHQSTEKWSSTNPKINLWHVFDGEINRNKGNPTGYHSRPGGIDAANARLVSIKDKPNRAGVYTATIEVRDGDRWKSKFSSFFPDDLSQDEVIDVILHAYKNSNSKKGKWQGPSGMGYTVQGWTTNKGDGINTAFPVFNRNQ